MVRDWLNGTQKVTGYDSSDRYFLLKNPITPSTTTDILPNDNNYVISFFKKFLRFATNYPAVIFIPSNLVRIGERVRDGAGILYQSESWMENTIMINNVANNINVETVNKRNPQTQRQRAYSVSFHSHIWKS